MYGTYNENGGIDVIDSKQTTSESGESKDVPSIIVGDSGKAKGIIPVEAHRVRYCLHGSFSNDPNYADVEVNQQH